MPKFYLLAICELIMLVTTNLNSFATASEAAGSSVVECPIGQLKMKRPKTSRYTSWIFVRGAFENKTVLHRIIINSTDFGELKDQYLRIFEISGSEQQIQISIDESGSKPYKCRFLTRGGEERHLVCNDENIHLETLSERFSNRPVEILNDKPIFDPGPQSTNRSSPSWIQVHVDSKHAQQARICLNHFKLGHMKQGETLYFQVSAGPQEIYFGDDVFSTPTYFFSMAPGERREFYCGGKPLNFFHPNDYYYLNDVSSSKVTKDYKVLSDFVFGHSKTNQSADRMKKD